MALRRRTAPQAGLDLFAVGLDRFSAAMDGQLAAVAHGGQLPRERKALRQS